jgi:hypothetical protein
MSGLGRVESLTEPRANRRAEPGSRSAPALILPEAVYHGALGLFKRRKKGEEVLRGHLERLKVSPFWLQSALDAIDHCERGEYFQPVFSVAGPAPARSVVALMRLEPFLRREIDWTISPSESPFWVGSVGDAEDELFGATAHRFLELYWSDENPSVRREIDLALQAMILEGGRDEPRDGPGGNRHSMRRGLWALGSAGFVWRVAESTAQTPDLNLRADLAKEIEAVVASYPREASDERSLGWAAAECVRRNLLFGSASPGGWASGGEFLRRGFRFAQRHVFPEDVELPRSDRWYAFSFGVALYDVDALLATRPLQIAAQGVARGTVGPRTP